MPCLVFEDNGEKKFAVLSKDKEFNIGRCRTNDIGYTGNVKVSRNHCMVYYYPEKDAYALSDLGSTNGTSLNGNRISSDIILADGDIIGVGDQVIFFKEDQTEATKTTRISKVAPPAKQFGLQDLDDADLTQTIPRFTEEELKTLKTQFSTNDELVLDHGMIVEGNKIVRKLGDDSIASVYLVQDMETGDENSMKVFKEDFSQNSKATDSFFEEIQKAAAISHPSFIQYLEAGIYKGHCFYTMNYYPNETLNRRIAKYAPFSEIVSLAIVRKIAEALNYAYTQFGMVHRDLKPSNVLYDSNEEPIITDYGMSEWSSRYLAGGLSIASPWYISPEQIAAEEINWFSDLYSLGIILFQLLTGILPFHSVSEDKLLSMHLNQPCPAPEARNPNIRVSDETLAILEMMTAKKSEDRFESWDSFLKVLNLSYEKRKRASQQIGPYRPDKLEESETPEDDSGNDSEGISKKKIIIRKDD
jgi:pSer/pThr/pTyr-binding forkhead associated (FHA) protein